MRYWNRFIIPMCLFVTFAYTQEKNKDSLNILSQVDLGKVSVNSYSLGSGIYGKYDKKTLRNKTSLAELLSNKTSIYFKSYGPAMLSSISLRGTSSSQTSVVWNGIPVNSFLNGQTDFNTISLQSIDYVDISESGASVFYGSGAIGGTIYFGNEFNFTKHKDYYISTSIASFNTYLTSVGGSYSSGNFTIKWDSGAQYSDNDYLYLKTGKRNENGMYKGVNGGLNMSYEKKKHQWSFYSQGQLMHRYLSSTIYKKGKDAQYDQSFRVMGQWKYIDNKSSSILKTAFTQDLYQYYPNNQNKSHSYGKAKRFITQYRFDKEWFNLIQTNIGVDYNYLHGDGTVKKHYQNDIALLLLTKKKWTSWFTSTINIRQEWSDKFNVPFIYRFDISLSPLEYYTITSSYSKNFRNPSFNDLYWPELGNPNLTPETSKQIQITQGLIVESWLFNFSTYYIRTRHMIQWFPINQIWQPENIASVRGYGAEFSVRLNKDFGEHKLIVNGQWSYTVSKDTNIGKQLMYVPLFKSVINTDYIYKNISFFYQFLVNGDVYALTGVEESRLDGFLLSNIGFDYRINFEKTVLHITARVNNLTNQYYTVVYARAMPNRNYKITITYNF